MSITRVFPIFAAAFAVIYVISVEANWALVTYHPRINEWEWLAKPAKSGPPMYWYGWIGTTLIGSAVLGILATMLPEKIVRRIPLSLIWIFPVAAVPILIYALRFFWRWE